MKTVDLYKQKLYAWSTSDFMAANDMAWPALNEEIYNKKTINNKLEFVLKIDEKDHVVGICLLALTDIKEGEEIGVTYGWNFWK